MAKSKKQPKKNKSVKDSSISKKGAKFEYDGKLSVVIAPFGDQITALKTYIQRVVSTINAVEIIVVGGGLDETQIEELQIQYTAKIKLEFVSNGTIKDGVAAATGDQILVVDDLMVSPRNLSAWLREGDFDSEDEIWAASRHHKETQFGDGYKMNVWAWLLNMFIRLLTGIVSRDVQVGFRLYPKALAHLLFDNLSRTDKYYAIEVLHQAKLYDIEVVDQPITISGEVAGVSRGTTISVSIMAWLKSWVTWTKHYFVLPAKDAQSEYFAKKESPWFRFAFASVALLLFVLMPYLSFDYGMTGDEYVQRLYGDKLLDYYDGKNFDALFYKDLYNYGGLFDYFASRLNATLGWFEDPYEMRHLLNSLCGAFMMLFVGLVGRIVVGTWMGGLLALLFVALSPRMFGHSMNNPKDIPFAAAYIFTVYHSIRFTQQLPKPTLRTSLAVILGIAAAINIRVGGLLLIAYLAAFSGITFLWKAELRNQMTNILLMIKMLLIGVAIGLIGLRCGSFYWPYATIGEMAWLYKPLEVLGKISHYYVGIRVLFDETNFWSDSVPWNYIPYWMLYTTPLFVLIGFVGAPLMAFFDREKGRTLPLLLVAFAGLFPICYVIYQKSGLYDAMRHMLFAYCFFPILAAFTWSSAMRILNKKAVTISVAIVMIGLMALPTVFMVKNHPYQYTYFNELIGGNDGAFMKYESDYWMTSMKPASEWYNENIAAKNLQDTLVVATNCHRPVSHYLKGKNIRVIYVRYHEREKKAWDYGIFYSRFINRKFLINEAWPPGEIVHEEKVDNVPLGVVVKRKSSPKGEAGIAFAKKDWPKAAALLEEIVKENPKNESALLLLSQTYSMLRKWPEMKVALDKLMALSDLYSNTWGMMGAYYMNVNKPKEAKKAFEKATEINYKYTFGNFHLARMYSQENNFPAAMKCLEDFDAYGGKPVQGYDLAIQIAQKTGNNAQQYYFTAKKMSINRNWDGALPMLEQALTIDPDYEPAIKMQRGYDAAIAQRDLKIALKKSWGLNN
jgi:tetratricopeptide (TPR) repeat protein